MPATMTMTMPVSMPAWGSGAMSEPTVDPSEQIRIPVNRISDNYMYDLKQPAVLPTVDRVGKFPSDVDVVRISTQWLDSFAKALSSNSPETAAHSFLEDGVWRDKAIFTGDYRTLTGHAIISKLTSQMAPKLSPTEFHLIEPAPKLEKPWEDLEHIQAHFAFKTNLALGTAVVNLVPSQNGALAWTLHTVLDGLIDHPDLPQKDGHMTGPMSWQEQRDVDTSFEMESPSVVIVGAGHNGLAMAARLQALGVKTLIIERNNRVGDNWRNRYESLSLHFPHWADHLPYMPYPEKWPLYCPAAKLGNWLESYADALDLKVWLSSSVLETAQDPATSQWTVRVSHNGVERVLTPKHVIMCTSLAGVPFMPAHRGEDKFQGVIRHSTEHDSSKAWVGKKVLVVGTSSSGFDTAFDFSRRGVDVTMLQRSSTYIMSLTHSVPRFIGIYEPKTGIPIEICDRIAQSMPIPPGEELGRRNAAKLAELDKDLLDGMEKAGFKCFRGQRETGTVTLGYTKNGGFYFDAGACEHVIDGRIKVEQGFIDHFEGKSVVLNGGRKREFDLVVMATGFSNTIDSIKRTLGSHIANRCGPIWGVDEEGELKGAWRQFGPKGLWISVGTLQLARFHSRIVALRIAADLDGTPLDVFQG